MRIEYKYLFSVEHLNQLRQIISPFVEYDSFTLKQPLKEYIVRSIYLDTPKLDYYYKKISGLNNRKKLRIRGYDKLDDEQPVFLEIKRKNGVRSYKNRFPVLYNDLPPLFITGNVEEFTLKMNDKVLDDGKKFFFNYYRNAVHPSVLIVYNREAYLDKANPRIRITLDKDLRFFAFPGLDDLYKEDNLRYVIPGRFILEVKFDHNLPFWFKEVRKKFDLKRLSASKYNMCLDTHYRINKIEKLKKKSYLNNIFETELHLNRTKEDARRISKYSESFFNSRRGCS